MLDSSDKEERATGKVERVVVHINNFRECMKHICEIRGYPLEHSYLKFGGDTGQGSFKFTVNLENIVSDGPSSSKRQRFSYSDGLMADKLKDSGVRRLIIVIIAEKIDENYESLKALFSLLDTYDMKKEHKLFTYAFDWKAAALFFGLGTAASTYPCLWCIMPKRDFALDLQLDQDENPLLKGGPLRTIEHIRENAKLYNEAKANHTGKNKLPSIEWFSSEREPIDKNLPGDCLVLDVLPPMSLHLKHGLVNETFDLLDRLLEISNSPISALDWSNVLGLERTGHLGGKKQFNGGDCHKLLFSLDKLLELLTEHHLRDLCEPVCDALKAFQAVVNSCFGVVLYTSRLVIQIRNSKVHLDMEALSISCRIKQ